MRSIRRDATPSLWEALRTHRAGRDRQGGQAIVMFALVIVIILATSALVIDVGMLRNDRQQLVNALDAGALAGAAQLPVDGSVSGAQTALEALVESTVEANYPGIDRSQYTIAYRCQVGVTDSNGPDLSQIPANCDPTHALGHTPAAGDFSGAGDRRSSDCDPSLGDRCNTVVVTGSVTQQYGFGPVVGVDSGSTGGVQSASCNGPCGAIINTPVDVVLIIDRTSSMQGSDTENAKNAAQSVVDLYRAKGGLVELSLSLTGPTKPSTGRNACASASDRDIGTITLPGDLDRWVPVGLTDDASSFDEISDDIGDPDEDRNPCFDNSSVGTDLADPIYAAAYELTHHGRAGAVKGIILETDGQPNSAADNTPYRISSSSYCKATNDAATAAKAQGIIIYTVGFFDASNIASCEDQSGTWRHKSATDLLASVSGTTSAPSDNDGCTDTENEDGDYFYCVKKTSGVSADLSSVFDAVASALAQTGPTLISLYPPPIVTGVGGPASTGADVTVSGKYFSGATKVTFGGAVSGSFSVTSDTSITARVPSGSGRVQVLVTTPGGTSYQDVEFTYSP